jgi:N-acetyl-anhydromuramyl-L-alanine amidase AmpD
VRIIRKIIIHCSDSDYVHHDNIETIRQWHLERGFSDIGYHFIITKDGKIHKGRDINTRGAHTKGHNKESIGICLTGSRIFSDLQRESLKTLLESDLLPEHKLDKSHVFNHSDLDKNKSCPNFNVHQVLMWER